MFQNGIAFDAIEDIGGERQALRIGYHVHAGSGEKVDIHKARRGMWSTTDIKVPSAERIIFRLARIRNQGERRLEQAA
jgi:hypothetical protein